MSSPAAEIQSLVQALVEAWNAHDADAFAQPFHPDADFTNVFGMHTTGRDGIVRFHAPIFATMFKDSHLEAQVPRVRLIRADVAAVDVPWRMTGARDPKGDPWPERDGLLNFVMTREGDRWGIAVMHNMDLPPAAVRAAQERLQRSTS